jgi:hypothetical protein
LFDYVVTKQEEIDWSNPEDEELRKLEESLKAE